MSQGQTRRPLEEARRDAEAFRDLFASCWDRWEVAGSVRRGRPEVGDIEHVVISRFGPVMGEGQLIVRPGHLLWERMDRLVAEGALHKAIYPDGSTRWGDKYRGVVYREFRHEVFRAEVDNWGPILAIRTGPADLSRRLVTQLARSGRLKQEDGFVRYVGGERIAVKTEEAFFTLCQEPWVAPGVRA